MLKFLRIQIIGMFRRISIIILILTLVSVGSCAGQDWKYEIVPSNYFPVVNPAYNREADSLRQFAADLTNYLPVNYVPDGSVDYSYQLQKGIDSNRIVLMPDFPVLTSGIRLRSGSVVIFQKNSLLVMRPSNQVYYEVLGIDNVNNVKVYFPKIRGEREQHIGTKGEWGFGIAIQSAKNISIIGAVVSNSWGDGIYINSKGVSSQVDSSDSISILIDGSFLNNNRRNGISIIEGNNIEIRNSVISNTNGTMPMTGIDIEPNNGSGELKHITLDSIVTFNNSNFGIFVSLTAFVSNTQKNIDLTIRNCTDDGSNYGMGFAFGRTKESDLIYAKGSIDVINPTWKNNRKRELWLPFYASKNNVIIKIKKPEVFRKGEIHPSQLNPIILSNSKKIIFQ